MLPRLIATDLDGTLLREDGTVDPRTRRALVAMQARGVEVVVCTARPVRWMRGLAAEGGISGSAVCANGAVLWDLDGERLIESFAVPNASAREAIARLRALVPDGTWAIEGVDRYGHEPAYVSLWPLPEGTLVAPVETLLGGWPAMRLILKRPLGSPPGDASSARAAVADLVELTWSEPSARLYEMSGPRVSKASGLAALCAQRGIDAAEVIAFGDMPNDLAMLGWAGRSVAMGNAHPDVISLADEVTATNVEHGVAVVLERLLADG